MNPNLMSKRAPHSPVFKTGWIHGWRLTFAGEDLGWEGSLATVVEDEDPEAKVFVVLYDMTEEDEHNLDSWEGTALGYYRKIRVGVQTKTEHLVAWLYTVDGFEGGLPSARYLGVIADSAEKAGAPSQYVSSILAKESRNVGPGSEVD